MAGSESLEMIDECTYKMPEGAYWDGDEMLQGPGGELLPDGCYMREDGSLLLYEGNFLNMPLK